MVVPFLIVGLALRFQPTSLFALLIAVLIIWIVVRSYRDVHAKEQEEGKS